MKKEKYIESLNELNPKVTYAKSKTSFKKFANSYPTKKFSVTSPTPRPSLGTALNLT